MDTTFYTQYVRTPKVFVEINTGESLVETAGYRSAKDRIEDLINAGQRLLDHRKEQYDFPDGKVDDTFTEVTRQPNFDMADATQISLAVGERLEIQNEVRKKNGKNAPSKSAGSVNPDQNTNNSVVGSGEAVQPNKK